MTLLAKNTDYAVRALIELGMDKEKYISIREISKRQGIPYPYLRKIFCVFVDKKIVSSKEGASGGVRLEKDPAKIFISDMIELLQGPIQLSKCMFRKKICKNRSSCVLRKKIQFIEEKVADEFGKITILDLIKEGGRRK